MHARGGGRVVDHDVFEMSTALPIDRRDALAQVRGYGVEHRREHREEHGWNYRAEARNRCRMRCLMCVVCSPTRRLASSSRWYDS